jgi:hypothetical protein
MCKNLLLGTIAFAALLFHQSSTTSAEKTIFTTSEKIEYLTAQKPLLGWNCGNCIGGIVGNQIC